ncbi:hypothetical protein CCH79_00016827, partial [Gambusia affinis]
GNLSELGKLLMQGSFNVWTDHKKGHSKVKDLARFKPMQRHLFLYDKMLLFCKKREENTEGHEKTPSYSFKHSLKMSSVGITENVKGDNKKFEVWYNGREEVYIIQAPSMDVKNMWVSEIRKVLTGQLEACREASQNNNYGVPMRNVRKMGLRQSYSSSPDSGFRRANPSPNMRQKKADASAHSAVNVRKHFTLQGLSNRRSLPAEPTVKEAEVTRRFSLTSSLASSSSAMRHTKGPLSASIKSKRHEIKSDPTPFGYEDTLRGAMAAHGKQQSMTSSIAGGAGSKAAVPRSTSQPGWTQRRLLSMDTDDFETIPSSGEESSNSSEDEADNKNCWIQLDEFESFHQFVVCAAFDSHMFLQGASSRYRVQLTYASCEAKDLQFLEEGENGNWYVYTASMNAKHEQLFDPMLILQGGSKMPKTENKTRVGGGESDGGQIPNKKKQPNRVGGDMGSSQESENKRNRPNQLFLFAVFVAVGKSEESLLLRYKTPVDVFTSMLDSRDGSLMPCFH